VLDQLSVTGTNAVEFADRVARNLYHLLRFSACSTNLRTASGREGFGAG